MTNLPPRKLPNSSRRDREFLYLPEIDALIAATRQTRAALLLQSANLSLHECCLLWNYYATSSAMPASAQKEYQAINRKREETFLLAFDQIKAFSGISSDENAIDYLLGSYLLKSRLPEISDNYWLSPQNWRLKTLPKTSRAAR